MSHSLSGNIMRDSNTFETRRKKASAKEALRARETAAGFLRKIEIVLTISDR
jgi:hypothetical protein